MQLSCPGEPDACADESEWHASWDGFNGDAMPCGDGWDSWSQHDDPAAPEDGSKNDTWELDRRESDLDGLPCNSFSNNS